MSANFNDDFRVFACYSNKCESYVAVIPELAGARGYGKTIDEAMNSVKELAKKVPKTFEDSNQVISKSTNISFKVFFMNFEDDIDFINSFWKEFELQTEDLTLWKKFSTIQNQNASDIIKDIRSSDFTILFISKSLLKSKLSKEELNDIFEALIMKGKNFIPIKLDDAENYLHDVRIESPSDDIILSNEKLAEKVLTTIRSTYQIET